jgi:antitoxin VapB
MALNIKNEDAHGLARELAELTGESMSAAVTIAVRERRDRLLAGGAAGVARRMIEIGQDCAARLPQDVRTVDHGELLYDESGLPR